MPAFPREVAYLWQVYHRLRRRIGSGFASANPVGWQDIDAFVRRSGIRLTPWEVEIIEAIDDALLQSTQKQVAANATPQAVDVVPASDTRGVRSLLRSIGDRLKKKGG